MNRDTLPLLFKPLMECRSIRLDYCAVCGRIYPLNQHHLVWRSWGEVYDDAGRKRRKPTITLCGSGNNLRDPDGRYYCHGRAHGHMLHFRYVGGVLEYLETPGPVKYQRALEMDGWNAVGR